LPSTARFDVDAVAGLTHSVAATSANVADVTMAGYLGIAKYLEEDTQDPETRCCADVRRGAIKKMEDSRKQTLLLAFKKTKASIRAKVEHLFHVIKNLFDYRKLRYKG
tara:strand:- start:253 stop:576 length:324 start_codon:yes stop_codon:yes gene_type:complete